MIIKIALTRDAKNATEAIKMKSLIHSKCKHEWKELSREDKGSQLKINRICIKCGIDSQLMPNLLIGIFNVPKKETTKREEGD